MTARTLGDWLVHIETLHARPIELGLGRVREVAERLEISFAMPTIVVGGTNGKGSTCAMLDAILRAAGFRVGVYTKPHLLVFNERARIDGVDAADAALAEQFEAVEHARGSVSLTYFEFSTLAILRLFARSSLDVAVLEIGLGGRLDAVNVIDASASIVTSVDIDHTEFLGVTREAIGSEKAPIYRAGRPAICGDPRPPESLVAHATEIAADLWLFGRDFNYQGDRQQWSYAGRRLRRTGLPYPALRGANQLLNASAALAALEALADQLPVSQQAVRHGLLTAELPARFQVLPGRPTIILDVAHNPHAAAVLAANLDSMSFHPVTHAVFGMLRDKDIAGVITKLRGRIDHWHVGPTAGARGTSAHELAALLRDQGEGAGNDRSISEHGSLAAAFRTARESASPDDRILAFGSFLTVADVMRVIHSEPN